MSTIPTTHVTETRSALFSKISWRILPFLLTCYTLAFLDRINIGFAKLQMQNDLGFSDAVYGLAAGIFFVGYVLFEVPSNLWMLRVGARKTISRIMVLWGITSAATLFVRNDTMFYCLRFLLGVFEAGFLPGMLFYLTYWYNEKRMARVIAIVTLAGPIGGALGGPMSTWILTKFSGAHGLAGWQWMFLLEGLPCVVLGVVARFFLTDRPSDAKWLTETEKCLLVAELGSPAPKHRSFAHVLKDPRIYLMCAAYFCVIASMYVVSFWLPTILKERGVTNMLHIGLYSAIPHAVAAFGMYFGSRSSDMHRERRYHSAVPALVGALAIAGAALLTGQLVTSLLLLAIANTMMYMAYAVFWATPSEYLKGDSAAGGIALINTTGLIGGFMSPTFIGWIKTLTGSTQFGLLGMSCVLAIGSLLLLVNRVPNDGEAHGHRHS
ncbi:MULTISPECIES: MFS transporter [unclassified Burkholderia]|uniref:MFS transporter n=1 Tax=unclassified Burkholderia TaxID=2613784 RepID=UPI002AB1DCD5|nr:MULTISPECIES: MFS transporter [unclassified Burkholderia]